MSSTRPTPQPTAFAELNSVLADLITSTSRILGDNFAGAYLQGSFAVGDADLHSDCDFLIPVHSPLSAEQETGLRALHDNLPTRQGHWTRHLEGSYPLRADLRSLGGLGREWLFVDHGWREMQWSTHCNTEVARWSLRERGVVLAGQPRRRSWSRFPPTPSGPGCAKKSRTSWPTSPAGSASTCTGWGSSWCAVLRSPRTRDA